MRVLTVREPKEVAVEQVADAADATEDTFAVVLDDDRPASVIKVTELDVSEGGTPIDRVDQKAPLEQQTLSVELPGGGVYELRAYVHRDFFVVPHHDTQFLVPLPGDLMVEKALISGVNAFAADTQLPNPTPLSPGDPDVTYMCSRGDFVTQPVSDPNRKCPICGRDLQLT